MSILGAESYAAVCHLVTDIEVLSREERNHVLWYACNRGDLSMVKSVIRAGCDVDHFHRGHTPLMIASIRGHDEVVKELILAGCKVDLQSSKCSVGRFKFITKMASLWSFSLVVWLVTIFFIEAIRSVWANMVGYWLLVLTIALQFLSEDSFKVSRVLRIKARIRYIAWVGIVPAAALVWRVVGTAVAEAQSLMPATELMASVAVTVLVIVTVLVALTGIKVVTVVKQVAVTGSGTTAVAVAVAVAIAGMGVWAGTENKLTYGSVGPTTIGNIVSVTGTLALVLSMAMAGADVVPFAVAMAVIVAVEVIMGNMWLALVNAVSSSRILQLLLIILMLALTPIGVIRKMSTLSITGMTALHYAAWYDHITCGTQLVEAGANLRAENKYIRTPLHICSHRFRAAVQRVQSHPHKQVIAVIGNAEYGKSTLIAALQSESRTLFQSLVYKLAQVYDITQRTTGIETVSFSSAKCGELLFYDFAGQSDYHGPHQPFLEAMLSKPGVSVTMLMLVKATEERAVITQQLTRWLQPVALTSTPSTPHVIVVGSFLDQAKSEKEAYQKLQGCIDSVQKEFPLLKVQELILLDCREPESAGIKRLRRYLQVAQPIQSTSSALMYNVHWIMAQLQKTFSGQSLQLSTFRMWLQDNAQILPSDLPPPEDICQDLSAAGYILFLHNKQDLSQSWLVLDLQTILHNVYGTLFSPSQSVVNQFGLLHCSHLSKLFQMLDPKMIQEVLITLEFCIRVDPLLLKKEILSLTKEDKVDGWLYFPALVSAKSLGIFTPDPQCLHWACWQLKTDDNHIILAHLLQGILLRLAATHIFIEKELPHNVRMHCCSVWVNGLFWGSATGVDVAIQISNSSMVQVIGRSREGPGELYRYMCSVTQSIFKTVAKVSPALKAIPYIIHPYTYIGLDESRPASPTNRYPVASIIRSIEAGHKYVHSLPLSSGRGSVQYSRSRLEELFGGWIPSLTLVQCLKEAQDPRECMIFRRLHANNSS